MNLSADQILSFLALIFAVIGMIPPSKWAYNYAAIGLAVILLAIAALIP